jgi:predicted metallopeptidase
MLKRFFILGLSRRDVMSIRYYDAPDVKQLTDVIVRELGFAYIDSENVYCFRSRGSRSKRTVARVHSLGKLWQLAIRTKPRYLIEVIAERYDKLSQEDREKVIIHELLHIPKGFSGGFRPHKGYITQKVIDKLHKTYKRSTTSIRIDTCL